jgi:hypothetical protein
MCNGRALGSQRDLLGHGPQKRTQFPRDGANHLVGIFPSGASLSGAFAESSRRLPTALLDRLGHLLQTSWQMPADCGGVARGPGAFDQGPAGMAMARLGAAALVAPLARRVCRGCEAQGVQQLSRVIAPGAVAACGPSGHCARALPPAESLESVDARGAPPGLPLVGACVFQTRQPCGVVGDRSDVCLAHDRRCRGGTDDLAAPPEVGWTPGGPARRTDSVPQEQGFALELRRLKSADGLCTRSAQVPHRCILHLGHVDRGAVPRAQQAGQCEGIPTVGVAPIPGLFGAQGGRHDPADMAFCGQRAGEPVPAGARLIDKEEMCACGLHLTDAWIDVTLSCPDVAEEDDGGVVCLGDVRHGNRLVMDIQADGKRARLVHG